MILLGLCKRSGFSRVFLGLGMLSSCVLAFEQTLGRELIRDNHFRRGFILYETTPGRHVSYGKVAGIEDGTTGWGLLQWSSKYALPITNLSGESSGSITLSNAAKWVQFGTRAKEAADLILAANSAVEYGATARTQGQPWIHLLVEQEFEKPAFLHSLKSARFSVHGKLLKSRNLHNGDYDTGLHAAQFQIFFTVQNRSKQSAGYGDLLWFGIPLYDNRDRFPNEFKSKDFGGTEKFIFTPGGQTYTMVSTHGKEWVSIDKDILPLMREGLQLAWAKGFLAASTNMADYAISGMNMGWELPGTFDVEFALKNLSLSVD